MNLFDFLKPAVSAVIVVRQAPLPEAELRGAFAVPEDHPLLRAVLQLIDEMEEQSNQAARVSVANHGLSASCNGQAERLADLRAKIMGYQRAAFSGEGMNQESRKAGIG